MAESRIFDGSSWITITDEEHRNASDPHTQYALADGTRGAFAPPLGAADNYVTDAEKAALHSHANQAALDEVSGVNTGDQDLSGYATTTALTAGLADKADATHSHVLADVTDYTPPDLSGYATTASLSTVATTGAYADLTGTPTIPDSPDDIGAAPAAHEHTAADIDSGAALDGHILTADGAGGAAWEPPPAGGGGGGGVGGVGPVPIPGLWLQPGGWGGTTTTSLEVHAYGQRGMASPVAIRHPMTIDALDCHVATAGDSATLVIYGDAPNFPLLASAVISTAATGWVIGELAAPVALPAGFYWVGVWLHPGASVAVKVNSAPGNSMPLETMFTNSGPVPAAATNTGRRIDAGGSLGLPQRWAPVCRVRAAL